MNTAQIGRDLCGNLGYVYVIADRERNMVKIGRTKDPRRRTRSVLSAAGISPDKAMVYVTPVVLDYASLEKSALKKFSGKRTNGEWVRYPFYTVRNYVKRCSDQMTATEDDIRRVRMEEEIDVRNAYVGDFASLIGIYR